MNQRVNELQAEMKALGLDGFIVTNPSNLLYLSQFDGLDGDGCLVITPQQVTLITDARYQEALEASLPKTVNLEITRDYYDVAHQVLADRGYQRVGFETSASYALYRKLAALFGDKLVPETGVIEKLREVKDTNEVAILRRSTQLASKGFEALMSYAKVGGH